MIEMYLSHSSYPVKAIEANKILKVVSGRSKVSRRVIHVKKSSLELNLKLEVVKTKWVTYIVVRVVRDIILLIDSR